MKKLRLFYLFFLFFFSSIVSAQEESEHNIYGLKFDKFGHVGMDVGTLNLNNVYTGIQGTIPYNNMNSVFYVNCVYGYGNNFLFNSKCILTGILGAYTNDYFKVININTLNYGCGLTVVKRRIAVGCSFTNRESFSVKIGFCY